MITKKDARTAARASRTLYGRYIIDSATTEYVCHLSVKNGDRPSHHVTVHHPAGKTPTAAAIDAAIIEHLTSQYDEDRCPHVPA